MKRLKFTLVLFLFVLSWSSKADTRISGKLTIEKACESQEAMVWLSQDIDEADILLLHTLVPENGTYAFSVKPGVYKLVASTQSNCLFEKSELVVSKTSQTINIEVKR